MTLDDHMNNGHVEHADHVEVVSRKERKERKDVWKWGYALEVT